MLHRRLLPLFFALAFSGCASGPQRFNSSPQLEAAGSLLASEDLSIQRQRFGGLADAAAGRYWEGQTRLRKPYFAEIRWVIPGVLLSISQAFPKREDWLYQFNAKTGKLDVYEGGGTRPIGEAKLRPNGWLEYERDGVNFADWLYLIAVDGNGRLLYEGHRQLEAQSVSKEDYDRGLRRQRDVDQARRTEEYQESQARWGAVVAASQTLHRETSQMAADQQREADRVRATSAPRTTPEAVGGSRSAAPAAPPLGASSTPVMPSTTTRATDGGRDADERRKSWVPTPEAVTVCTLPSGPNGSFTCRSPLNMTRSGHLKDISGQRTPEEMVTGSAACTSPRRLVSTTHQVWGCGFGATGVGDAIDVGGGVSMQGRKTFYCAPKESSCRRESPQG